MRDVVVEGERAQRLAGRPAAIEVSPVEVVNAAIERTEARNEPYDTYTLLQANAT